MTITGTHANGQPFTIHVTPICKGGSCQMGVGIARVSTPLTAIQDGRTLRINRHGYTVVGVAPPGFQGSTGALREDAWIPLSMDRQVWGGSRFNDFENGVERGLDRLPPADRHVAVQDFLEDFDVRDQPVARGDGRLQQALGIRLVGMGRSHEIHGSVRVDEGHGSLPPA